MKTLTHWRLLLAALLAALFLPGAALAVDTAPQPDGPVLTGLPIGIIVVSFVMTGIGYGLNYALPFLKTEQAKGVAHAVYQAVGVILYELATGEGFGLNEETGVAFLVALATWGVSHGLLYRPTGWNGTLGGGRNLQDE